MDKWDNIAESWVRKWREMKALWRVKEIKDFITLCKNGLVLDLGCGAGRDAQFFNDSGLIAIGLDFSSKMLSLSEKPIPTLIRASVTKIPFINNSFRGVWSNSVLKYLSINEMQETLREVYRVLQKDGYFWLTLDYGERVIVGNRCGVEMPIQLYTEKTFSPLIKKFNFDVLDVQVFKAWRKFINFTLYKRSN